MDYRKLDEATKKDHFPLPFIDQMLDQLAGKAYYCFLDGYSRYNQIAIAPKDQEKTTFSCPYGTYAFQRMSFRLCNAPATFQRCTLAIFWWKTLLRFLWTISWCPERILTHAYEIWKGCSKGVRNLILCLIEKNVISR
ncbi:hypothetical protein GQ457_02G027150 [Hibiscus cannabinus]